MEHNGQSGADTKSSRKKKDGRQPLILQQHLSICHVVQPCLQPCNFLRFHKFFTRQCRHATTALIYTRRHALRPASTMWASKWPHVRCWWELEHSKPAEFRALGPGVAMAFAKRPAWLVDNPRPRGSRPSAFAWRPMLACTHLKVVAACAQPQRLQHPERGV